MILRPDRALVTRTRLVLSNLATFVEPYRGNSTNTPPFQPLPNRHAWYVPDFRYLRVAIRPSAPSQVTTKSTIGRVVATFANDFLGGEGAQPSMSRLFEFRIDQTTGFRPIFFDFPILAPWITVSVLMPNYFDSGTNPFRVDVTLAAHNGRPTARDDSVQYLASPVLNASLGAGLVSTQNLAFYEGWAWLQFIGIPGVGGTWGFAIEQLSDAATPEAFSLRVNSADVPGGQGYHGKIWLPGKWNTFSVVATGATLSFYWAIRPTYEGNVP